MDKDKLLNSIMFTDDAIILVSGSGATNLEVHVRAQQFDVIAEFADFADTGTTTIFMTWIRSTSSFVLQLFQFSYSRLPSSPGMDWSWDECLSLALISRFQSRLPLVKIHCKCANVSPTLSWRCGLSSSFILSVQGVNTCHQINTWSAGLISQDLDL